MLNESSLKAEQTSVQERQLPVECCCGWHRIQGQLLPSSTKNRSCPECRAEFKREPVPVAPRQGQK